MKIRTFIGRASFVTVPLIMLVACKKLPKEVEVVERRELNQYDNPAVFKSGYDTLIGTQPVSWRRVNRTKYRLLNYAAGKATQIAVGYVGSGGVLNNMNRWKKEFGQEDLLDINSLVNFEMLGGSKAYMIQLKGAFQTKLGGLPVKSEDWAVTGVICDVYNGSVVTVKMMGPESEVEAQQENLMKFVESLKFNTLQEPNEEAEQDSKVEEDKANGGGY